MGSSCSRVTLDSIPSLIDDAENGRGELVLSSSGITAEGARIIASRLTPSSLVYLDLGDNLVTDAGSVAICEALPENLCLKRLVLSSNALSDVAVEQMVNALVPNKHLRHLDLYDNEITAKGAQHLRRLLQRTHHLESVLIGSNSLGDEGVKHLCKGMRKNHRGKLRRLGLSSNGITNEGAERLWLLIDKRVHSITECTVTFNDIDDYHLLELIQRACEKNLRYMAVKEWSKGVKTTQGKRKPKYVGTVDELSLEQIASIKDSFRMFDKDGDGSVDAAEIHKVLEGLGHEHDAQTVLDMIADADADGNGIIEEKEFVAMMARQMAGSETEDEDDSGDSDVSDDELEGSFANPLGIAAVAGGAVGAATVLHSTMGGVGATIAGAFGVS